jgi:phenylpyruvate tautomerase PptA (4-oxalocrotonate tautomerase family)
MRLNISAAAVALAACAAVSFAQPQAGARTSASAQHSTAVKRDGQRLDLASGTRLTGELQSALDVSRARVGDRVVLKTTEAVKQNGRTVLKKGSQLVGRITDVQRRAKGGADSSVTVLFDTVQSGSLTSPISLTIDSVARANARSRAGDEEFGAEAGARTSARGGSSGGGLLGGTVGAVGNTVGGVTGAAGDVVGSTAETAGGAARGVGSTLGRVRVTQSAGLSAEGGSTLSLAGGDLRLEKGTTFRLTVSESARVN